MLYSDKFNVFLHVLQQIIEHLWCIWINSTNTHTRARARTHAHFFNFFRLDCQGIRLWFATGL